MISTRLVAAAQRDRNVIISPYLTIPLYFLIALHLTPSHPSLPPLFPIFLSHSHSHSHSIPQVEFPPASDTRAPKIPDDAKDLIRACLTADQKFRWAELRFVALHLYYPDSIAFYTIISLYFIHSFYSTCLLSSSQAGCACFVPTPLS